MLSLEDLRFAKGFDPIADFQVGAGGVGLGTIYSDVVKVSAAHKAFFIYYKGVGTTGTATLTVNACDDASPTTHTPVAFRYRRMNSTDTPGAVTAVGGTTALNAAGLVTTAGSSDMYVIEVDCKSLASLGYSYVALKCVELTDSPVAGCILIILVPRYADDSSAITA